MGKGWHLVIAYDKYVGPMVCNNMCRHGEDNTAHLPAVHTVADTLCHCEMGILISTGKEACETGKLRSSFPTSGGRVAFTFRNNMEVSTEI